MKILIDTPQIKSIYGVMNPDDYELTKKVDALTCSSRNGPYTVFTLDSTTPSINELIKASSEGRVSIKVYLEIEDAKK